jgi:YVTN family beta-propeller protein
MRFILFITASFTIALTSCMKEKGTPDYAGFPDDVGRIITTKCATAGCHNDRSKDGAGGISLESWEKMFEGGRNSAAVVPYSHEYSILFSFTNTYSDLGLTLEPTMPFNKAPLSREEVTLLRDWIDEGAPNRDGFVKFSDNPNRPKIYVANQGCDVVTVIDAATKLPMRYIPVGRFSTIESPHMLRVAPNGEHWYVIFTSSNDASTSILQKFSAANDHLVANITIPNGNWNTFTITSDSKKAFLVDWAADGKICYVDLETNSVIETWAGSQLFIQPHGSEYHNGRLYVTAQTGNFIYKIDPNDPGSAEMISLEPSVPPSTSPSLNIHEIHFIPDGSKYIVTCQGTNDIRIIQASNDSVLAVIPVPAGSMPSEIASSASTGYAFITCMEDQVSFPGVRGSVAVINYQSNSFVSMINTGFQPHGIAVYDDQKLVYVANRNVNMSGPAPHHGNHCGGRNGYITYIDISTLQLTGKSLEVSADPYSVAVRP